MRNVPHARNQLCAQRALLPTTTNVRVECTPLDVPTVVCAERVHSLAPLGGRADRTPPCASSGTCARRVPPCTNSDVRAQCALTLHLPYADHEVYYLKVRSRAAQDPHKFAGQCAFKKVNKVFSNYSNHVAEFSIILT